MFIIGLLRKVQRQFTAFLPVAANRTGSCKRCGECCKLPYPCPMLRYDENGKSRCAVYFFRPPSCRVYPRTFKESMTREHCGFRFENPDARPANVPLSISARAQTTESA